MVDSRYSNIQNLESESIKLTDGLDVGCESK